LELGRVKSFSDCQLIGLEAGTCRFRLAGREQTSWKPFGVRRFIAAFLAALFASPASEQSNFKSGNELPHSKDSGDESPHSEIANAARRGQIGS
jgi:hypothetical protein